MFPCPYSNEHDCDEAFQSRVEASHHAILSHQVVPIHKTEDGQFICLHAEFGCSATFETTTLLTTHTQSEHRKEAFPCALAWSRNCTKTFTTRKGMAMHINAKHRQIREPCPSAKETGCKATFSDVSSAHSHVRHVHGEKPYPCPLADEYDCTEWLYTVALAQRHGGICHKKLGFPCLRAEQLDCMARFNSKLEAQKHLHEEHQPNPFPCPGAEKYQCEKRFPTYDAARKHMGRDHERFPCPRAEELGCSQTFSLKLSATKHAQLVHDHIKFPCPYADTAACDKVFASVGGANRHAKYHTNHFPCQHQHCGKRFLNAQEAIEHSRDPQHSLAALFICTLQGCRGAIAGKRYLAPAMRRHHQTHVELGEVVRGDESIISSAEGSLPSSQLSLFWSILEHSSMDLTETGDGCNDDDMSIEGDCDEADEEDETLAPWEEQNSIEASPEERRRQIHESNTAKWSKLSLLIEISQ